MSERVLAGPRAVTEALRAAGGRGGRGPEALFVEPGFSRNEPGKSLVALAERVRCRVETRPREALDTLTDGARHQGVVAIAGAYRYATLDEVMAVAGDPPLVLALDQITDPHNFGAMVRTAVALGVPGILTLARRAAPVTGVVVRTSAGASEHARIAQVTNLARTLRQLRDGHGLDVVGLDAEGTVELGALPPAPRGRVLVVGSEGKGLRRLVRESCDVLARVPLVGPVESLNASVAASLGLYEAVRQR